jgi:L-ascorbate metabolism protein UlaG (beta-lactamase superfamily)
MLITRIGGPTALIEWSGWRILTDPTFDPPGRRYSFGLGTSSRKTVGPALSLEEVGAVDLVLLSHHGHADNLDDQGRAGLSHAGVVATTLAGAKAIHHHDIRGLKPGDSTVLTAPDRPDLHVTATPGRHGPPLSRALVGPVLGFALRLDDAERPGLWMTGDTVLFRAVRKAAKGMEPDVMLAHVGAVRFPLTARITYTMDAAAAVDLAELAGAGLIVPVHVEGWSHFAQKERAAARAFEASRLRDRVRWVPLGEPVEFF